MPRKKLPGFTDRPSAQRQFGRSKSSFIRDVDEAFARSDTEFLSHFRVLLNDGIVIEGPDATKDAIQQLQSKQPRWHIETAFLETRYWDNSNESEQGGMAAKSRREPKRSVADIADVSKLQHELELANQKLQSHEQTINALTQDKSFLQEELQNRRGGIDKLRGFFESVGDAADSTAKLKQGSDSVTPDATTRHVVEANEHENVIQRHLPTIKRAFNYFRRN